MARRALVIIAFVALAGTHAEARPAWSVAPPKGWIKDEAAAATMREQLAGAFFKGLGVVADAIAFRHPDDGQSKAAAFVLQLNDGGAAGAPSEVVDTFVRELTNDGKLTPIERTVRGSCVRASWTVEGEPTADSYLAIVACPDAQKDLHLLGVSCIDRKPGRACPAVIASMKLWLEDLPPPARARSPLRDYRVWIGIVGGALLVTGIVGSIVTRRRKR